MENPSEDTREVFISLIVGTRNEADTITDMLLALLAVLPQNSEVIVVDDDSPDGTWKLVGEVRDERVKLIRRVNDRGLGSAIVRGIVESRGNVVGWLDADAWMIPEKLLGMIDQLKTHHIVIASRYVPGGGDERDWIRVVASRLVNGFARAILGGEIRDYTSNFAVLRREVFDSVLPFPIGFGENFIDFVHRARCKGLSIKEIPYFLKNRTKGQSKATLSWFNFFSLGTKYAIRILVTWVRGVL